MSLSELDKTSVILVNVLELGLSVPFDAVYDVRGVIAVMVICAAGEGL